MYLPETNIGKFFNFISEYRIKCCGIYPLPPTGYLVEILENLLFHVLSNDACKCAINLFPITWGPLENVNLPPKTNMGNFFNFISEYRIKSCGIYPLPQAGNLVEILENLLFHVLSNDACKCAITLFPITWGPLENVNLLYFLLKIQISNGCNVLNIAGNPMKDINVNLSFLSSGSKVVECTSLRPT